MNAGFAVWERAIEVTASADRLTINSPRAPALAASSPDGGEVSVASPH
jgi:hypothetical protein